ncbi:MAG TPA: protein kinase, partial [Gemmata sp.]|nr:protein kinase [Gemmata sp.]
MARLFRLSTELAAYFLDATRHANRAFSMAQPVPTSDQTSPFTPRDRAAQSHSLDITPPYPYLQPPDEDGDLGRLAGYRVFGVLGSGGMGTVFAAEDVALRRPVALKVMNPELASDPRNGWQRFFREARALAAIKHPNLVTVYQVGHEGSAVFLAMELLEGQTLARRIIEGDPATPEEIVRVGAEVAAALAAIHSRGLIHRDIKPANIWIDAADGRIKLLDFGLVRSVHEDTKLTEAGMVVGTPAFMSPEQMRCRELDSRTDLFSLGCVLYALGTRTLPFDADNPMAMAAALAADEPVPVDELNPAIPTALAKLIMQLLAKDANDRPASAIELIDKLSSVLQPKAATQAIAGSPSPSALSRPSRSRKKRKKPTSFARRHAVKIVVGLWIIVGGLIAAALAGGHGRPAARENESNLKAPVQPQDVYLAKLTPEAARGWPPFQLPPGTDGSVRVGGELSPNGMFMHPAPPGEPTVLVTFRLGKAYSRFTTRVALNDSAPPFAPPARFLVYRDGVKWDSGPVARNESRVCDL